MREVHFYCQACSAEVASGASSCPSCGLHFLAIRCPICDQEGSESDFRLGCRSCGYLGDGLAQPNSSREGFKKQAYRGRPEPFVGKKAVKRYWILTAVLIVGMLVLLYWHFE